MIVIIITIKTRLIITIIVTSLVVTIVIVPFYQEQQSLWHLEASRL